MRFLSRPSFSDWLDTCRAGKAAYPPLVGRMVELCKRHLASPGSSRDMAAKLLGRLLTRPDTGVALQEYVRCCSGALETDDVAATFLVPGGTPQ